MSDSFSMPPSTDADALDEAIRARLAELVNRHTQAKIAARTGVAPSNVSRYLSGTRIPASFCAAVVTALRVNPTWLVMGEGAMYLDDVSADTAATAGSLSALVQAMTNLASQKLGGLLSIGHQRALYDLDQNFHAFERAKRELNERTRPVLANALGQFEQAILDQQWARAKGLRDVAQQAARLCEDVELRMKVEHWQAHLEYYLGNWEAALAHTRKVFLHHLYAGDVEGEHALQEMYNYALIAAEFDHIDDADRVTRMAMIFAEKHPDSAKAREIAFLAGAIAVRKGDLIGGMPQMLAAAATIPPDSRDSLAVNILVGMLMNGSMALVDVLWRDRLGLADDDIRTVQPLRARAALHVAAFREVPAELRDACDIYTHKNVGGLANLLTLHLPRARFLLAALDADGRTKKAEASALVDAFLDDPEAKNALASTRPSGPIDVMVSATQIARLVGDERRASALLLDTAERLDALSPEVTLHPLLMARHAANALTLIPPATAAPSAAGAKKSPPTALHHHRAIREAAAEWVCRHLSAGFGFLQPLALAAHHPH